MLFIDPVFIFVFLPVSLAVYLYFSAKGQRRIAVVWLVACSLYFYQSGNTSFLWVMLFSIAWNYAASLAISRPTADRLRLAATIVGIAGNLALLGYYKYYLFIIENLSFAFDYTFAAPEGIALPLGISFFTFQQITFLVDTYRGLERKDVLGYALFVSFFPQLIAGPIVHHHEMMPQFEKFRLKSWMVVQGFSFFAIGLFKKICIADSLAPFAGGVFDSA
ncbi:MAG: MBOAT family protein, partial [Rhodospirillales bacterium]